MKFKSLLFLFCACAVVNADAQTKKKTVAAAAPSTSVPRPKLVVGIVVDQMRWDYLYRFYDRYSTGGFKRMLNEGFTCENTNIDYMPSVTAIGHSSIYTGSVPAIHGIAGNDFTIQSTGKNMYCAEDTTVQTVGSTSTAGKMSPRNLLVTTVTDELKLATNFRSKVIGIALKDRGGILPAGHAANAAYWFDDKNGAWITSTYYMNDLPQWVKDFNAKGLPEAYLKKDWNTLYPINTYLQSTPDETKYEGKLSGASTATFPIKTSELYKGNMGMIRSTPYGNSLTLDLAMAAVNAEQLGNNVVTDFLAVSLSSTDYVGHQYGTNAVETEDTYLRLDKDLAAFFAFLDSKVGKGQYTVFLSADHGAVQNSGFLNDHNIPAELWDSGAAQRDLNKLLEDKYKAAKLVLNLNNFQVNLNNVVIKLAKLDEEAIKADCIAFLEKQDPIQFVVDMKKASTATIPEELRMRIINGYNTEHSGVIQIVLKPNGLSGRVTNGRYPTGTTHGAWNPYDTHIPMVFFGWGINHGATSKPTHMTDIAPTVSALLHIQAPNGNIGHSVSEVLKADNKQ
jgi:predicted AlkP superfamily pyrophosphatase or phosphodiesterase